MDHRPKCKIQNCKTSEGNIGKSVGDHGFNSEFLKDATSKAQSIRRKKIDVELIKTFAL